MLVAEAAKAKSNFFGAKYHNKGKEDKSQAEQEDKSQAAASNDWIDVDFLASETEDAQGEAEAKEDAKSPANANTQDWFDIDVTPWAGDTKANSTQGVKFVVKPESKATTSDVEEQAPANENEERSVESIEKEKLQMEKAESSFVASVEGSNASVAAEGHEADGIGAAVPKDQDSSKAKQQEASNADDVDSKDTSEKVESVEEVLAESLIAFPEVHVVGQTAGRPHPIETSLSQAGHPELANILAVTFKPGKLGIGADWKTGRVKKLTDKNGQGAHFSITPDMMFKTIDGEDYSEALLDKKVAGKQEYEVVFSIPSHDIHASESMLEVSDSGAFGKVSDSDYEDFGDESFIEAEDQYDESATGHLHDAHEYDGHGDHDAMNAGYDMTTGQGHDDHYLDDIPHDDYHGAGDVYDDYHGAGDVYDDHHHDDHYHDYY